MRTNVELITTEMAKDYLSRNFNNRPLIEKTVSYYADQMKQNLWALTGQGISFDESNKLIDGQHRLAAIIKANKPINILVIRGVQSLNFEFYDLQKTRSSADVLSISGIDFAGMNAAIISRFHYLKKGLKQNNRSQLKELKITPHYIKEFYYSNKQVLDIITPFSNRNYKKLKLIPAALVGGISLYFVNEFNYPIKMVTDFFNEICTVEPDKYKCTESLRILLIRNKSSISKIQTNELINIIFLCFISYNRKQNALHYKQLDLSERPIIPFYK